MGTYVSEFPLGPRAATSRSQTDWQHWSPVIFYLGYSTKRDGGLKLSKMLHDEAQQFVGVNSAVDHVRGNKTKALEVNFLLEFNGKKWYHAVSERQKVSFLSLFLILYVFCPLKVAA